MEQKKVVKQLVANCIVTGGRASTFMVQKIADAVTIVANKMFMSMTTEEHLETPKFKCDITTNFKQVSDGEIIGYLFEVTVHYTGGNFTMRLTLKPFQVFNTEVHLEWQNMPERTINLSEFQNMKSFSTN
jgi:hypothetical protein